MISIVLPFYNKWELMHNRLFEFYKTIPKGDIEIIIINDASNDTSYESGLAWWQKLNFHPIRYRRNKENLGFGGSMNAGAKMAKGDIIVFHSNDVKVLGNFIPDVISANEKYKSKVLIGEEIIYWDSGWNTFVVDGQKVIVPYVNGWFLACSKEMWNELDGFDPIYGRFDYEDIDLSTQVLEKVYNLYGMYSKKIQHLGGATISSLNVNRMSMTERNKQIYIDKWIKKLPNIINLERPNDG
jgi:GT2 family glycosyltransferase